MKSPALPSFALVAAILTVNCAYHAPDAPTPPPPASTTAPAFLTLGAAVGTGVDGGKATVSAKVQNVNGATLEGVTVAFQTTAGTIAPAAATTGSNGIATTTIAAAESAKVTATAGAITSTMVVSSQPATVPPGATPNPEPPPSSPLGPLSMTATATGVLVGNQTLFTLNVLGASGAFNVTWDYGDGATGTSTSSTTAHQYAAAGTYRATAILRDDAGRSTSASVAAVVSPVPVVPPPPPPSPAITVTAVASPALVTTSSSTTITVTATPVNGAAAVTSYTFDCETDGTLEATQASPTFACTFATTGAKTVTVTATNGTQTGTSTAPVTVSAAPPPTITVTCNTNGAIVGPPIVATTCAVAATVNGAPVPSSRVTSVVWSFGDSTADVTKAGNLSPAHTYVTANTYTVIATATISAPNGGTATNSTTTTIAP